jgi:hypothetical protein
MTINVNRWPSRANVVRALREIAILWRPPDPEKDTADSECNPKPAAEQSEDNSKYTPARGEPQRGAA